MTSRIDVKVRLRHNDEIAMGPGKADLLDKSRHALLEEYVRGVVTRFKDDPRVQCWDIWNEPDNMNDNSYGKNRGLFETWTHRYRIARFAESPDEARELARSLEGS